MKAWSIYGRLQGINDTASLQEFPGIFSWQLHCNRAGNEHLTVVFGAFSFPAGTSSCQILFNEWPILQTVNDALSLPKNKSGIDLTVNVDLNVFVAGSEEDPTLGISGSGIGGG